MKKKAGLLWLVLMFFAVLLSAQESLNFKYVDSVSFAFYKDQDWKSLSKIGRKAFKQDIDYFYLRMRTGIADFEQEKYISSPNQFSRALGFSTYDFTAKSYLYYSLLLSGKQTRANRFSRTFSDKQIEKLRIKPKAFSSINFYFGCTFTNNISQNGNIQMVSEESPYGEQMLLGNQFYSYLGLIFNFSRSVSLTVSTSFLNIDKTTRFQYQKNQFYISSTTNLPQGGYVNNFSERLEEQDKSFDGFIRQNELYLNAKIQQDNGWAFNLFSNVIFNSLNRVEAIPISVSRMDTLRYNAIQNTYTFVELIENDFEFYESDTSFVNWVAGFNLQKDFDFIKIDLSPSFSHIYDANQFQIDLSATYYPLGSLKLYGQTGGIYFSETNKSLEIENRFLFYQAIGVQLSKRIWIEADYFSGNLKNVNLKQAAFVYNLPDKLNYLAGLNLYIFVNEHLSFSLLYDFADKTGYYYTWDIVDSVIQTFNTNYQTHSLIGGIKWRF